MTTNQLSAATLPVFDGPQAWIGPEAARSREWIHELDRE